MKKYKLMLYFQSWAELWGFIGSRHKRQLINLLFLMLIASFFEAVSIGSVAPFLGILLSPESLLSHDLMSYLSSKLHFSSYISIKLLLTGVFCSAVILAGTTRLILAWYTSLIAFSVGSSLSGMVYEKALYQPYKYHLNTSSSAIIATASTKAGNVIFNTVMPLINLINSGLMLLAIMSMLLIINAMVATFIFVLFFCIYIVVTYISRSKILRNGHQISLEQNRVIQYLQEGLRGIKHIIIDGNQSYFIDKYKESDYRLRKCQGNNQFIAQSPKFIIETLGILGIALAGYFYSNSDAGDVQQFIPLAGVLVLSSQRLLPSMQQAYSAFSAIRSGYPSLVDVLSMLRLADHQKGSNVTFSKPLIFREQIEIRNLSFKYTDDLSNVFEGLSTIIRKGECVGVIGKTGSGKSTLIDLIAGLLEPSSGEIMVDGVSIDSFNARDWRSQIAYVPQSIFLSDGTIAENIALGIPVEEASPERIRWAARQAKIDTFIDGLSNGYQSLVGDSGIKMSGGQRQRLGIARALYKSASVIILDEATSALDSETEDEVMNSIDNIRGQTTIFIVTHRVSKLNGFNKIIKIDSDSVTVSQGI